MQPYLAQPIKTYLDTLATDAPTPGGGSVAALVGALAAGLNSMVASFTVGREKYAAVEAQVRAILEESEALRCELARLMDADTEAYAQVSAAYGMPRATDGQKSARTQAIQQALRAALVAPMDAARAAYRVIEIAAPLVDAGNPNLVSDVGVAAKLGQAALECAALNVEINLAGIKDDGFCAARRAELAPLVEQGAAQAEQIWSQVRARIVR